MVLVNHSSVFHPIMCLFSELGGGALGAKEDSRDLVPLLTRLPFRVPEAVLKFPSC